MRKNYILLILGIVVLSTFVSALFVRMNSLNQTRDDGITRKTLSYPVMVGVVTNVEKTSKILCEWNLTLNVTGDFYKQHLGSRIFYVSDLYLMMQNARDFDMAGVKGSGIAINYVADGFGDILNYRNFFFFKQSDLPFYNRWANFEG